MKWSLTAALLFGTTLTIPVRGLAEDPPEPAAAPAAETPSSAKPRPADGEDPDFKPRILLEDAVAKRKMEGSVRCVWFTRQADGKAVGGTSEVTVRLTPNPSGQAAVGVLEEFVGGAGDMWRTSAWIAALNATSALDKHLTDYEVIVKTGGFIDGPSAGMLCAATMLALLNGDPLLPDTTMTGAINPDGTAGPVGGIHQKMSGAFAAGIRRFGYPIGNRMCYDPNRNAVFDVETEGKQIGLEVVEIRDITGAYSFLTGKPFPVHEPVAESDMEISPASHTRVTGECLSLLGDLTSRHKTLEEEYQRLRRSRGNLSSDASALLERLKVLMKNAAASAADASPLLRYVRLLQADYIMRTLANGAETLTVKPGKSSGARQIAMLEAMLERLADRNRTAGSKLSAYQMQIASYLQKTTIGGEMDTYGGLQYFAQSNSAVQQGRLRAQNLEGILTQLKAIPAGKTVPDAMPPILSLYDLANGCFSLAETRLESAKTWMALATEHGPQMERDPDTIDNMARSYASAGVASLAYFDALVIKEEAASQNASVSAVKNKYTLTDPMYPVYETAARLSVKTPFAEAAGATPESSPMERLAHGSFAYLGAAELVVKHYSLHAEGDPDPENSVVLGNRKALGSMIDAARQRTLEEAGLLKERFGMIPETVKLYYQLGSALRLEDDASKLQALAAFWRASLACHIARTYSVK